VLENPDKPWEWEELSQNTFGYNTTDNQTRIQERTKLIKEELIRVAWHPDRLPWVTEWDFYDD
jgi:hypothetical protein